MRECCVNLRISKIRIFLHTKTCEKHVCWWCSSFFYFSLLQPLIITHTTCFIWMLTLSMWSIQLTTAIISFFESVYVWVVDQVCQQLFDKFIFCIVCFLLLIMCPGVIQNHNCAFCQTTMGSWFEMVFQLKLARLFLRSAQFEPQLVVFVAFTLMLNTGGKFSCYARRVSAQCVSRISKDVSSFLKTPGSWHVPGPLWSLA